MKNIKDAAARASGSGGGGFDLQDTTKNKSSTKFPRINPQTKEGKILTLLLTTSLNRFQAIRHSDTAINSTISTLCKKGLKFNREWEKIPCVGGTKTTNVVRYSLSDDEKVKARRLLGLDDREAA